MYLSLTTQLLWIFGFSIGWAVLIAWLSSTLKKVVAAKPWCPCVVANQKLMLYNFGFPSKPDPPLFPLGTSDEIALGGYVKSIAFTITHGICGGVMLPALLWGWDGCGALGQTMFVFGTLADVGFDVQDLVMEFLASFFPDQLGLSRSPKVLFYLVSLHHLLAMVLVIPMNLYFLDHPSYHRIAFNLLFAAAISLGIGAYKMTLDVANPIDFRKFKAIIIFQTATILYTRVVVWFPEVWRLCAHVYAEDFTLLCIGIPSMFSMSLFNLLFLNDSLQSLYKWFWKATPTSPSVRKDMTQDVHCEGSSTPDVPNSEVKVLTPRSHSKGVTQQLVTRNGAHRGLPVIDRNA